MATVLCGLEEHGSKCVLLSAALLFLAHRLCGGSSLAKVSIVTLHNTSLSFFLKYTTCSLKICHICSLRNTSTTQGKIQTMLNLHSEFSIPLDLSHSSNHAWAGAALQVQRRPQLTYGPAA